MQRVAVVGTSCSGKTTLARQIAVSLSIPHMELDALFWGPNWTPSSIDEFRSAVDAVTTRDRWVVDGNYSKVRDIIWARATHLVWINYPFAIVFYRAIIRTVRRVFGKEELFSGNRETARQAFFSTDSILLWVIRSHHRRIREYRKLIDDDKFPHLNIVEFHKPTDAHRFLISIREVS